MSALAQQELLEQPPRRRLIVPAGHSSHWGVDPSSKRVAVAGVLRREGGELDRWVEERPFGPGEGGQRLSGTYWVTRGLVERMAVERPPGVVFVEQPSGKFVEHGLEYAVGVILAAVFDGVLGACGHRVRVETIPSSSWKKLATGYGSHSKPTRKKLGRAPEFLDYGVAKWARLNGYAGSSWDAVDAMGIAEAARREVALDER